MKRFLVINDDASMLDDRELYDTEDAAINAICDDHDQYGYGDCPKDKYRIFEVIAEYAYVPPTDKGQLVKKDSK